MAQGEELVLAAEHDLLVSHGAGQPDAVDGDAAVDREAARAPGPSPGGAASAEPGASAISRAVRSDVPEGASILAFSCVSMISACS